jgi:Kef-type K+ transport system membrane component KefB
MGMNVILSTGVLICTGYILGEIAEKIRLPKISGYILAGILLNPDLLGIMSGQFVDQTGPLLTISLSVITFSIGGTLSAGKLKKTGKTMLILMLFESLPVASTIIGIVIGAALVHEITGPISSRFSLKKAGEI